MISSKNYRQISETFFLGAILAVVGGFLDAYTYLTRGGVFANAQTGNIVLFGVYLAKGEFFRAFYYLVPISAFVLGVFATELIREKFKTHTNIHWRQIIVAVEIVVIAIAAFLPQGKFDMAVNTMISFLCSMQVQSFRKLGGNAYATTMCTGNLRSASETLYRFRKTKDTQERRKSLLYYGIIFFFILGAAFGAGLVFIFSELSALFGCFMLLVAFFLMFIRLDPQEQKEVLGDEFTEDAGGD